MIETRIVIPCHNEAKRLAASAFLAHLEQDPALAFTFVDDGSTDATFERLRSLEREGRGRIEVLAHSPNRGKSETVRFGLRTALATDARFVGFLDADLATPLSEMTRLRALLDERPGMEGAIASRVPLLGGGVERAPARLTAGRMAAWTISRAIGLQVGDASCGAKLFRASDLTRKVFADPFLSRWIFDVEILVRYRMHAGGGAVDGPPPPLVELPVLQWHERGGSKIRTTDYVRALRDLFRVRRHYVRLAGARVARAWPARPCPTSEAAANQM